MPIKTYGIAGKTSAVLDFRHGQTKVRGTFAGGIPDPLRNVPAVLVTGEPFVQYAIEHDPRFGKLIKLLSVRKTREEREEERRLNGPELPPEEKKEAPKPAALKRPAEVAELKSYPDVTNVNEAREVLAELGATAAQTINKDTTRATARALGVRFPNWK